MRSLGLLVLGFLTLGVVLTLIVGGLILQQMRVNDPEGWDKAVSELTGGETSTTSTAAGESLAIATAAWLDKVKGPGSGDAALYVTLTGGESGN